MQDLLGDLIQKGEKCGSKQDMFPTKRERCSQEGKTFQMVRHAKWIKSTYERGVANRGRNEGGNHSFKGRPRQHWMVVSIQASVSGSICQFLQILCLLSLCCHQSPKRGEIVTNMAPFMPFRVILVIE